MKTLLLIALSIISLSIFSQVEKNWRLFPGKELQKAKAVDANSIDSATKVLNYNTPDGIIKVVQPKELDELTTKHKESPYILGYTVQLEVSQQTSKIRDARYRLLKLKPNSPIEEIYSAPNTYLYGGAFYTRTDAYAFKDEISSLFPSAIVISKKLALPPLKTNE